MTRLFDIAAASAEIATTGARSAKTKRLAAVLRAADTSDVRTIVAWLSGELTQRRIGVGWAALASMPPAASDPSLAVADVERAFSEMAEASGAGSQTRRASLLEDVLSRSTAVEQSFLRGLLAGNLRQGALAGVMADAIAIAAAVTTAEVRRATMLRGDLPTVAEAAMRGGSTALAAFRLEVGCALAPMLAQSASSVAEALEDLGAPAAFEAKLDGARIQIHKRGDEVRLFTRSLDDVTARLGHVAADVARWPVEAAVADGEILWFAFVGEDRDARPLPSRRPRRASRRARCRARAPRGRRSSCSTCSTSTAWTSSIVPTPNGALRSRRSPRRRSSSIGSSPPIPTRPAPSSNGCSRAATKASSRKRSPRRTKRGGAARAGAR